MLAVVQEACINCGDGKCDEYETVKNCPEDCIGNITNCSELPPLAVNVVDRDSKMKFTWDSQTIIPGSKLFLQDANECNGTNCSFGEGVLIPTTGPTGEHTINMPEEPLKFYRVVAKVKIGQGSCEPQCMFIGTESEGWYDPCTEALLKLTLCSKPKIRQESISTEAISIGASGKAHCCFINTRSQGWYDVDCDEATTENLITYDITCHLGAQLCDQPSNTLAKFTQNFLKPAARGTATSINWMNFLNVWGVDLSKDLFLIGGDVCGYKGYCFDYVARWDAQEQEQFGTAEGDPKWICEGEGKLKRCWPERVFTGVFPMQPGMPYFVSIKVAEVEMTYVGKLPEHVTYEFKYGPSNSDHENYIVLPLDTTIKKASQLCDIRDKNGNQIVNQQTKIEWWDPLTQERIISEYTCYEIIRRPYPPYDFYIEPGQVYLIFVQRYAEWLQT